MSKMKDKLEGKGDEMIQRYAIEGIENEYELGDHVRYADHLAEIDRLRNELAEDEARLNAAEKEIERLREDNKKLQHITRNIYEDPDIERLIQAAEKAGITYVGCDTPDRLADTVLELKAALAEKEREIEGLKNEHLVVWGKSLREIADLTAKLEAAMRTITDLEEDARRFPTMAEFSNLQDDHDRLQSKLALEANRHGESLKKLEEKEKSIEFQQAKLRSAGDKFMEDAEEMTKLEAALHAERERGNGLLLDNLDLLARLHEVYEIYAGMEGFIPETAPEGSCLSIIKKMAKAAEPVKIIYRKTQGG